MIATGCVSSERKHLQGLHIHSQMIIPLVFFGKYQHINRNANERNPKAQLSTCKVYVYNTIKYLEASFVLVQHHTDNGSITI